jgi:O-antigen biosynthesis protein
MTPRVSVLIGAYNNASTLERAARSMLCQTVDDLELLIVDDGSSDSSAEVAGAVAATDPRVRVVPMPRNVGIARSLNAGTEAASAPYVAVLDADDWSEPTRLERQLGVLEGDSGIAVVGCRMREVDERGKELVPRTSFASGDVTEALMRINPIPNTSSMFRRDYMLSAGGYDPRYLWATEYDLWLRLAERHRIHALDEVLATRQMSSRNVAARRERAQIGETIVMRVRAIRRRRSVRGATGLVPYVVSYVTPIPLKRFVRRRIGQAP